LSVKWLGNFAELPTSFIELILRKLTNARLDLRDLFAAQMHETVDLRLRLSRAGAAEKALMAFNFNDSIDPRLLKRAIVRELLLIVDDRGIEADERDLRTAIDLAAMMEPEKLSVRPMTSGVI
jgi:type III restriction enzyme